MGRRVRTGGWRGSRGVSTLSAAAFLLVLVAAGAFFLLVGSIGVVRLPDFYTRIHAVGKSESASGTKNRPV